MKISPGNTEITVVGAGLIGLASAWALQRQGWTVRVLEAETGVALETSFANAGMITPSMADPWNSPGIWRKLVGWLGQEQAPMLIRPSALPQYLSWGLRFLAHSAPARHGAATRANFRLASLSLSAFQALRAGLPLHYDLRTQGTLQVFRHRREWLAVQRHIHTLQGLGLRGVVLEPAGIAALEPLLEPVCERLLGGVHYPDDETGDARLFCLGLAAHLQEQGVEFEFLTQVRSVRTEQGRVVALDTSQGERPASRVVLACAAHTAALTTRLGLPLAIRPVKGYSLTIPVDDPACLPSLSVIDHHLHAAMTPLQRRLRVAGTAEFSGWDPQLRPERIQALWSMLKALLPQQYERFDRDAAEPWCGFRPMAADGLPYIGPTPVAGLYLNAGQGHLGWTQSLGSGQLLAALISGQQPPIDPTPFRVLR